MSFAVTHCGFLGVAEREFTLTASMLLELERATDCGLGALFRRVLAQEFRSGDVAAIIRLALVGAGENPKEAARLVKVFVEDRPLMETLPLAVAILEARLYGRAEPPAPAAPAPIAAPEPAPAPAEAPAHLTPGIGSD